MITIKNIEFYSKLNRGSLGLRIVDEAPKRAKPDVNDRII